MAVRDKTCSAGKHDLPSVPCHVRNNQGFNSLTCYQRRMKNELDSQSEKVGSSKVIWYPWEERKSFCNGCIAQRIWQ